LDVFTFVLCPHTTPPLDLLPFKTKKNQISQGDFVSFLPLCCAFGVPEFFLFVGSRVHSSFIATFDDDVGPSAAK
jgi:hypothetical protein